jgi:hypothetical protein
VGRPRLSANAAAAPDGNTTADQITASTATPIIQQQVAGLVDGGTYTFYVWAKVASGTKSISIAIANNAYGAYLAGPTQVALTTTWQRFRITGTLAGGQTGLWIVVRQYDGNGDNWTSGAILLWGACIQQGSDPKKGYARTWAFQKAPGAAGVACGPLIVSATPHPTAPGSIGGPQTGAGDAGPLRESLSPYSEETAGLDRPEDVQATAGGAGRSAARRQVPFRADLRQ